MEQSQSLQYLVSFEMQTPYANVAGILNPMNKRLTRKVVF